MHTRKIKIYPIVNLYGCDILICEKCVFIKKSDIAKVRFNVFIRFSPNQELRKMMVLGPPTTFNLKLNSTFCG